MLKEIKQTKQVIYILKDVTEISSKYISFHKTEQGAIAESIVLDKKYSDKINLIIYKEILED